MQGKAGVRLKEVGEILACALWKAIAKIVSASSGVALRGGNGLRDRIVVIRLGVIPDSGRGF
jgi:hypothetical protein